MTTFLAAAKRNELTGADEQEAGNYEADWVDCIAAEAEDLSLLVGSAGRVCWLGWPGWLDGWPGLRHGLAGRRALWSG